MNKVLIKIGFFTWIFILASCVGDSNPGFEFMPNMYRSPSLETYSEHNIEGYNGLPVEGTISRGHLSTFTYDDSDEEYKLAGGYKLSAGDILINYKGDTINLIGKKIDIENGEKPIILNADTTFEGIAKYPSHFSKDDKNLKKGKELYGMMCTHCHGDNGEGDGKMKKHAAYSAVPAYNDDLDPRRTGGPMNELKSGHIFHTITYGLSNMGPHASQVTEEERWLIVNYIQQELQHYGSKK